MSLLLQALQKAAKNREGQGPAIGEHERAAPTVSGDPEPQQAAEPEVRAERLTEPLEELTLAEEEDLFGPDVSTPASAPPASGDREPSLGLPDDLDDDIPEPAPAPAPARGPRSATRGGDAAAQAATILRANEAKGAGVVDWVRDRPVHTFAIVAGIFGAFYGTYVYLQIFHPALLRGDFLRQQPALQARTPDSPPPRPLSPPDPGPAAQAPAQPPGLIAAATPSAPGAAAAAEPPVKPAAAIKPATRPSQSAAVDDPDEGFVEAPAKPRRAPRRPTQVDTESVTLDDTVSVRTPEPRASSLGTLTRAWEALQEGRYEQAQALYDEVSSTDPANVDALLGLAALATLRGNPEQASRLYGRALELDPRNSAAQAGLIAIIGQADPQLSETRLKQLISREPSGFLYFALGNLYARQSAWPQAQQAYFQAYQLHPDNPDYAYNLAVGLEHLGQSKIALNYYRRALELRMLRGRAEFDQTRVEERIGQLAARVGNQ
jgi:Tfp pilus assembly protein PilF